MYKKKFLFCSFLILFNSVLVFAAEALQQLDNWQLFYQKNPEQVFKLADANVAPDYEMSEPGYWNKIVSDVKLAQAQGKDYGCYRTVIKGLDPSKKYEILQKDSPRTSCAVYVNRQLVTQAGDPFELLKSEPAKGSHSKVLPISFEFFPDENGNAEIIFFISNYFYRKSGLHDTVYIGPTVQTHQRWVHPASWFGRFVRGG